MATGSGSRTYAPPETTRELELVGTSPTDITNQPRQLEATTDLTAGDQIEGRRQTPSCSLPSLRHSGT